LLAVSSIRLPHSLFQRTVVRFREHEEAASGRDEGYAESAQAKSNAKSNAKRLKVGGEGYAESSRGKSTTNSNAKRLKAGDEDYLFDAGTIGDADIKYVYEESARAKAGAKQSAVLEALAPPG